MAKKKVVADRAKPLREWGQRIQNATAANKKAPVKLMPAGAQNRVKEALRALMASLGPQGASRQMAGQPMQSGIARPSALRPLSKPATPGISTSSPWISPGNTNNLSALGNAVMSAGSQKGGKMGKLLGAVKNPKVMGGAGLGLLIAELIASGMMRGASQNRMEDMQMDAVLKAAQQSGGSTYRAAMGPVLDEQLERNRQAYLGQLGAMGGGLALGEMAI